MGTLRLLRVAIVYNQDFDPAERDSSFASRADVENAARDVAGALAARGHEIYSLVVPNGGAVAALGVVAELERQRPDLVFNLCESLAGDARHEVVLPALLDLAGLPYTGSGPLALGLALRKDVTKRILVSAGVPTPEAVQPDAARLPFPLIVKPMREDASVGISRFSVVHDRSQLQARVAEVECSHRQPALVERYIEGRELYVSLLGPEPLALPMHEIDFSDMPDDRPRIVTYEAKWDPSSLDWAGTTSVRARPLDEPTRQRCEGVARAAFHALGLRDYARVDLRLAPDGTPYVIDVNPNCDLSDGAGVSRAASFGGLLYPELIERICVAAIERQANFLNESEHHAGPSANAASADLLHLERAPHSPAAAGRSAGTLGSVGQGRPVHQGGDLGRARARRRRAR